MRNLLCCLLVLLGLGLGERVSYEGYQLLELSPTSRSGLEYLRQLEEQSQVKFAGSIKKTMAPVHVAVPPHLLATVQRTLFKHSIGVQLVHPNLEEIHEAERQRIQAKPRAFDINDYNTLADIYSELDSWAANRCPSGLTCETTNFGTSFDGQDIPMVKFSSGSGRSAVWVDANNHAREWLSTATTLKLIDHVYDKYGSDPDTTRIVDTYDWYFAPMVNPDGYEYSWTDDRYWKKNRKNYGICVGVDLNRNYDVNWGLEGCVHSECSDSYCGASGASEPETQAVQDEIIRIANGNGVISMVTLHAYGRLWMFPPGNTVDSAGEVCDRADDHDDMMTVADAAANAIEATGGLTWDRGTNCEVFYAKTGASDDWAKFKAGVKYAFKPELRGNGFDPPADQIDPSYVEVWAGLMAMVDAILTIEGGPQ